MTEKEMPTALPTSTALILSLAEGNFILCFTWST